MLLYRVYLPAIILRDFMKITRRNKRLTLASTSMVAALTISGNVLAMDKIPAEDGLSGFVLLGASYTEFSSNMISGSDLGDAGSKRIDSLTESPNSAGTTGGFFTGELKYTFAETRTQLFLGNTLEDLVRYDFAFQGGVRQEISDKGILSGSILFSGIPTDIWADPYLTGEDREETERDSSGGRIGWSSVMGTGLEVNLSHRKQDIDDERSGESLLGLTIEERELLSREGDQITFDASYKIGLAPGQAFIPKIRYNDFDLDGEAMSRERFDLELAYALQTPRYSLVSTISYAKSNHDAMNPIYDKTEKVDTYGLSLTGFYHQPFDLKGWSAMASIAGAKADSNIDFYDADIAKLTLGMMYRF